MHTQRRYKVVESGGKDKIIKASECTAGEEFLCNFVGIKEFETKKPKKGEDATFKSFTFKLIEDCVHGKSVLRAGTSINVTGTAFENMTDWLVQKKAEKATLAVIFEGRKILDNGLPYNLWEVLHVSNVKAFQASSPAALAASDESEDEVESLGLDEDESFDTLD